MANKQTDSATIRELRGKASITQVELAKLIGVHSITVSKYERGLLKPSGLALQRLAIALDVDASLILLEANVHVRKHNKQPMPADMGVGTKPSTLPCENA